MSRLFEKREKINKHLTQRLQNALLDKESLEAEIEEFEKLKENDEILIPISNGIFAKGKLTNVTELKVNVGAGVVVGKTIKQTIKIIDDQMIELKKLEEKTKKDMQNFMSQVEKMVHE